MIKNEKTQISAMNNNYRRQCIVNFEAQVQLHTKLNLTIGAVNNINLGAGFEVEAGGEFYANVSGDCPN